MSLVLIAIAAYFSYGFFQFDEHYQVVELVGLKLGKTPKTELPWEFRGPFGRGFSRRSITWPPRQ